MGHSTSRSGFNWESAACFSWKASHANERTHAIQATEAAKVCIDVGSGK
jgi:hypothetical protein